MEMSANEIEMLVLKAARGGGCPLGLAEDLAVAIGFVDLEELSRCPCDSGAVEAIPSALDRLVTDGTAQKLRADPALVAGYVAAFSRQIGTVAVEDAHDGTVTMAPAALPPATDPRPLGRRVLRPDLLAHLQDMAARTLVPETEASRVAGAGAGLTDND